MWRAALRFSRAPSSAVAVFFFFFFILHCRLCIAMMDYVWEGLAESEVGDGGHCAGRRCLGVGNACANILQILTKNEKNRTTHEMAIC